MKTHELRQIIREEINRLIENEVKNEEYYAKGGYWEKYVKRSGITGVIDELIKEFNLQFQIPWDSDSLKVTSLSSQSFRVWTRGDGSRYKLPGEIRGSESNIDEFWGWLQGKPGVKNIGKVGGEFSRDKMEDSVQYKDVYLSKRSPESIIFGSINRVKSNGGAWTRGSI
jgi:hypothetical protein